MTADKPLMAQRYHSDMGNALGKSIHHQPHNPVELSQMLGKYLTVKDNKLQAD